MRAEAKKAGFASAEARVEAMGGNRSNVALDLVAFSTPAQAAEPDARAPSARRDTDGASGGGSTIVWIGWSTTAALAIGTAISAYFAKGAMDDYEATKTTFGISHDQLVNAQNSARKLFITTGALGAATLVAAGVSAYVTLTKSPSKSGPAMGVRVGPGSVGFGGAF
jgi:hypothetical protein